ncbi:4-aminobutyrate transaminase [Cryptococcus neoformans]|uniref:4-aminobutyrate transaminase n=1 Tax=Cryptococcus neoformans Tu259-1 TaxID=1230072 RepID=A0A854Q5V9_CRYNE|nr:4-aminobutyrate transaminase [Cryptococcus neoformans var. grubii Tu259-1]OXG47066.1 4-aminobutyrate transaminase [Cryptococcus neoformans var. grubii Th84]OXH04760.1 4-aminobutyrate transaminase [Cryptococcus neoformans var. grubii]OXH26530.1 4-aminobutyrate transaminase [Cryptococcus neoformans var. grubii]OXH46311.1 4-aminobutyrate transaminase [Cryptococcus neoformans var. grubii]
MIRFASRCRGAATPFSARVHIASDQSADCFVKHCIRDQFACKFTPAEGALHFRHTVTAGRSYLLCIALKAHKLSTFFLQKNRPHSYLRHTIQVIHSTVIIMPSFESAASHIAPLPSASKPLPLTTSTEGLQALADKHITKGLGRLRDHVFKEGKGLRVLTTENQKLLDFTSGIGVTSLGHAHPDVTAAIISQAQSIIHVQCAIGLSEPYVQLVESLLTMMPDPSLDSFFFWNSGSEAIEAAIKVSRTKTKRNNIVVMQGGYHGRTSGAAALTRSKTSFFRGTGPLMPCVYTTPFPYWHAMGLPKDTPEDVLIEQAILGVENLLQQQTAPEDTAAIFLEPVIGEGGYIPAPTAYVKHLRKLCDKYGIMLVVDEIQTGFGRTGKTFAIEHTGVTPDIMVYAKGFANGMPISGIVTRKEIMDVMAPGSLGGTYSGNVVACAAALATTQYMRTHDILGNVQARSEQLFRGLREIQEDEANGGWMIEEVRGKGLMIALEFKDPNSKLTSSHNRGDITLPGNLNKLVQDACYDRGLLVLTTSIYPVLRLIPALVLNEEEVDEALKIMKESVKEVARAIEGKQ